MKTVIEKILMFVLKAMLNKRSPMFIQCQALSIINTWTDSRGVRYLVAADIQPFLSQISGYPLCDYCQYVVWPGEKHDYCDQQLDTAKAEKIQAEIDAAWEEYDRQKRADIEAAWQDMESIEKELELDEEKPEKYTEVLVGDGPGGFVIYE